MSTVNELRSTGNQVYVSHYRLYEIVDRSFRKTKVLVSNAEAKTLGIIDKALPHGGRTYAKVIDKNGKESVGVGYCHAKDSFSKKLGTAQAIERALSDEAPKEAPQPDYPFLSDLVSCACGDPSCNN